MNTLIFAGSVMSIIHSIFNKVNTSYTVIESHSNKDMAGDKSLSIVLLSRGGRPFRKRLLEDLLKLDICEVITLEVASKGHLNLEEETKENDKLKFLILKDEVSPGEMVNIGISEAIGSSVFVLWDDMKLDAKSISYRVFEKVLNSDNICTVPNYLDGGGNIIPTQMTPLFNKGLLKVIPLEEDGNIRSLYPYQYSGIYNREIFIRSGGYDIDIKNSYWQKLDFGLRVNMWGERIICHKSLSIVFSPKEDFVEDITPDDSYRLYCLKNISIKTKKDVGYLPTKRFFSYYEKSGSSLVQAYKTFKSVQKWVKINRFRFKFDAPELTKSWDKK